jgi:serine phosphatase RsbU (regulator of sigma subunit)
VILILLAAVGLLLERKAGSVAIAVALLIGQLANAWVNSISHYLGVSDLRFMPLGPVSVDIRALSEVLFAFVTLTVLYLRFRVEQLRQVSLEQEMASARRMQEQLLGGNALRVPGFSIEAVYRPATEVGGDFYRTVSLQDGSLLVVVGDVSGKGLDAAMLVASVLGSLANEIERSPAQLLEYLNRAVSGKTGGGFITACCARFYPAGRVVIANAGHISPYLNGSELQLENGLPLGVSPQSSYSETEIQTGSAITFLSDGVVEARDAKGELLGFERMAALTTKSAAEIAEAAQRWGQEDDITVLTVQRTVPA